MFNECLIVGGGQIGSAIATLISSKVRKVYVYDKNTEILKKFPKLKNIVVIKEFPKDISEPILIIIAIPSNAALETIKKISRYKEYYILSLTKGLISKEKFISELIPSKRFAVLSGPNFADELLKQEKSFSTLASKNKKLAINIQKLLSSPSFNIEITDDVKGVEACGVFKNIYAIGSGLLVRCRINSNLYYYYIGEFLREYIEIIKFVGGRKKTALLNCGFGDFLLTCLSDKSRNKRFGKELKKTGTIEGLNSIKILSNRFLKRFKYINAIVSSIKLNKSILEFLD